jgi:hypothetical protein
LFLTLTKVSSLKHNDDPKDYLYQDPNNLYTPAIHKEDFKSFKDSEKTRWSWDRRK